MTLLELIGVTKDFDTQVETLRVLKGVSLKIAEGETLAVTGPSGSGKSTLLGLMAGLDRPTTGQILYRGGPLQDLDEDKLAAWRRHNVGFIFQGFRLVSNLSALENVMLPLELLGLNADAAASQAAKLLSEIGLAARLNHFPRQLSGGEQQRVAIARAYAHGPGIIFADEPTGSLDRETAHKVFDALLKFNAEKGAALVLVTHDASAAARMGRVLALDRGALA